MPSTEGATVTAHDWVLGVAFSVLASVIGGASKLSIRKSWIIDAQRKRGIARAASLPYEEVIAGGGGGPENNDDVENETNVIAPLEVGGATATFPPPPSTSFRSQEYETIAGKTTTSRLFGGCVVVSSSPGRTSWILYLSGMVGMSFLNPLCCVLAMRYANPSILAPFSGLTLVWVVLFSAVALDEHPGGSQRAACALIVLGEVLVAAFGDHTNGEDQSVEDVLSSYQEPAFRAFVVFMTLYLLQLGIFIWFCPKTSVLRKVAWGSIGGSITGFQNFLKDTLTIYHASNTAGQNNRTTTTSLPGELYAFVFLGMLTAFAGLLCLAACMKRYDATYSAAMFVVSFVLSASLMSAVHYHTLDHLDGFWNYVMYPTGLATLFLGAFVLAKPDAVAGCCGRGRAAGREGGGEEEEGDEQLAYSGVNASSGML